MGASPCVSGRNGGCGQAAGPPAEEAAAPPAEVRPDRPRSGDGERLGLLGPDGMAHSREHNTETLWVGKTLRYPVNTEMYLLPFNAREPCGNGQPHK